MSREDLMGKLGVSKETLDGVIRSCGYTDIKNFHAVHENVMRSFIKKADIKVYPPIQEEKQTIVKTEIVSDIIENVEVVTVVRKELIELISRAYHKGIEAGKNSIFIADKARLEKIFEEAING
jgi:hypothetical protein